MSEGCAMGEGEGCAMGEGVLWVRGVSVMSHEPPQSE